MEKKFYDTPGLVRRVTHVDGSTEEQLVERWYQKRCSAAQLVAFGAHVMGPLPVGLMFDANGKPREEVDMFMLMSQLHGIAKFKVLEHFFGILCIPEDEFYSYDKILERGSLIMSINDPDMFVNLFKQVWADFLSENKPWIESVGRALASQPQTPSEKSEPSSMPSTPTSSPPATENGTGSSGDSAVETSDDSKKSEIMSPSN